MARLSALIDLFDRRWQPRMVVDIFSIRTRIERLCEVPRFLELLDAQYKAHISGNTLEDWWCVLPIARILSYCTATHSTYDDADSRRPGPGAVLAMMHAVTRRSTS